MHILVTGATGFLGGAAARELLRCGHRITGTGRNPELGAALERDGVRFQAADLRSGPADLLTGTDAVLHCAARSTLWGSWAEFRADNIEVSAQLARACARQGVRLVHISTPSVYNATGLSDQVPESATESASFGRHFDSRYARSKFLAELEVRLALPGTAVLRPRGIYGPGDTSIMPRLARALRAGRLPRLSRSEVYTELTDVRNVIQAARRALEGQASGVFNVTDGVSIPIWATLDRLADALGVARPTRLVPAKLLEGAAALLEGIYRLRPGQLEPPVTASAVRLLTRPMTLDLRRARSQLGYQPTIHPRDGLDAVFAALK